MLTDLLLKIQMFGCIQKREDLEQWGGFHPWGDLWWYLKTLSTVTPEWVLLADAATQPIVHRQTLTATNYLVKMSTVGLLVKTPEAWAGARPDPWSGTKIPRASWHSQKEVNSAQDEKFLSRSAACVCGFCLSKDTSTFFGSEEPCLFWGKYSPKRNISAVASGGLLEVT